MQACTVAAPIWLGAFLLSAAITAPLTAQAGQSPFLGKTVDADFVADYHVCTTQYCRDSGPIHQKLKIFVGTRGFALHYADGATGIMLPLGKLVRFHLSGRDKGYDSSYMVQLSGQRLIFVGYDHRPGLYDRQIVTANGDTCSLSIEREGRKPDDPQYSASYKSRWQITITQQTCRITEGAPQP